MKQPARGQIWKLHDDSPIQHVLVVSADAMNNIETPTIVVVPIVKDGFSIPARIRMTKDLSEGSAYAACDRIVSIKRDRLDACMATASVESMQSVDSAIANILGLRIKKLGSIGWGGR